MICRHPLGGAYETTRVRHPPLFGWGIGLGVHAWTTYRGDELSEERIRAEMNRIAGG